VVEGLTHHSAGEGRRKPGGPNQGWIWFSSELRTRGSLRTDERIEHPVGEENLMKQANSSSEQVSRRRELVKAVRSLQDVGYPGGEEPILPLLRMPEERWTPQLRRFEFKPGVWFREKVGPEGVSLEYRCDGCSARRAFLIRPDRLADSAWDLSEGVLAAHEEVTSWHTDHWECKHGQKPLLLPGHVHPALEILRKRAESFLRKGDSAPPMMLAVPAAGPPLLLNTFPVFGIPMGDRYRRGFRLTAAVREYMRKSSENFLSVIYYCEAFCQVERGEETEARTYRDNIRKGALDPKGRHETAQIRIETASVEAFVQAPIIRASGVAERGPGKLGAFNFLSGQDFVFDELLVEEWVIRIDR